MTISFLGPTGMVIDEVHELEITYKEKGSDVRYIGISKRSESFFGIFRRHTDTYYFYADEKLDCYNFSDHRMMPNTTEAFKEFMAKLVPQKTQEKYIFLLESAKKIS